MKVLLTLILMTNIVLAQEYIGIYAHLRKIKMRILAAEPTLAEYKDFQQRTSLCGASISDPQNKCLNEVLKSKVSEYLAHPIHAARSVDFVHELLYLRPLSSAYEYQQYELQYYKEASSLTQLTDAIFTTNKSWDEFFTSGQYSFFANMRDGLDKSEVFYYLNFVQEKDKPIKNERNYYVQVDEEQSAGFITTPRFLNRNYNNSQNSGRKRAAAILRVAFCDHMFPAVERGQEHLMVEEQIAKGLSFEQIVSANSDDHGRKADCMQCHIHKGLDHISQTFNSIEGSLDTKPSPGRLRYTFKNGKVIDEQVEGIGDLVKKIIIQDEFKQCQVKNFWKRFVGPTDYLDDNPDVLREFVNEFEKNKRRVNSFIRVLVLSKEFRQNNLKTKGNQFYLNAKRVLAKCVDCHGSTQVDFTKVPIGGSQASHQKMISRIVERLALKPLSQAQTATMPPEYSNWFPTQEERKAIVDWIQAGTPDLNGQNQLNNNWIENYYKGEK